MKKIKECLKCKKCMKYLKPVLIVIVIIGLFALSMLLGGVRTEPDFLEFNHPCYSNIFYTIGEEDFIALEDPFISLRYSAHNEPDYFKEYIEDLDGKSIHLHCLEEVYIMIDGEIVTLKDALESGSFTIKDLLARMEEMDEEDEEGFEDYFIPINDDDSWFGWSLIKCEMDTDMIIIGPMHMIAEPFFCFNLMFGFN